MISPIFSPDFTPRNTSVSAGFRLSARRLYASGLLSSATAALILAGYLPPRELAAVTGHGQLQVALCLPRRGHGTVRATQLGREGMSPDTIDSAAVEPTLQRIRGAKLLRLLGRHEVDFDEPLNLLFHTDQVLPGHSN